MKMMSVLLAFVLSLIGCSTTPDPTDPPLQTLEPPPALKKPRPIRGKKSPPPMPVSIDYEGLSRSIGIDPPRDNLGFNEKRFNTCSAGYGYSASQDCRSNYFTVLNFRLLCRDSEGTVSETIQAEDLKPLSGRMISWTMNGGSGNFRLDNQGYGQIKTTSESSLHNERLKITADNDFLYMRAGQVHRIVTPANWCN